MSMVRPNPRHVSQAPTGLLNEKSCGRGGRYEILHLAHSSLELKARCRKGRFFPFVGAFRLIQRFRLPLCFWPLSTALSHLYPFSGSCTVASPTQSSSCSRSSSRHNQHCPGAVCPYSDPLSPRTTDELNLPVACLRIRLLSSPSLLG